MRRPLRYDNPADYEADLRDGKFKRAIYAYDRDDQGRNRVSPRYLKAPYEVQCVMLPRLFAAGKNMNMKDIVPGWKPDPTFIVDVRREPRWWERAWNRLLDFLEG